MKKFYATSKFIRGNIRYFYNT